MVQTVPDACLRGTLPGIFYILPYTGRALPTNPIQNSRNDRLTLSNLFITAICRCVPPQNKPTSQEIETCLPYLQNEMVLMQNLKVIVALGGLAFNQLKKIYKQQCIAVGHLKFSHNQLFSVGKVHPVVITSYHPSRQNTQTGKLTEAMFDEVWANVNQVLQEK